MGGILIIFAVVVSTLLWANLTVDYVWLVLMVTIGFGLIGFARRLQKLTNRQQGAFRPKEALERKS